MAKKIWIGYIIYIFSYILVYPVSYVPLVLVLFGGLLLPERTQENLFIVFGILVTIIGAIVLNYFFRKIKKLPKNNMFSLAVFFAHLILIPATYLVVLVMFRGK